MDSEGKKNYLIYAICLIYNDYIQMPLEIQYNTITVCLRILYTPVKSYVVKQPQEKWACDFHDDAPPLSFQLQVAEVIF